MKKRIFTIKLVLTICLVLNGFFAINGAQAETKNVVVTTFPIYQIVRNVVQDKANMKVQLMLPAGLGCPHHHALTPHDMKKIDQADVIIINGLGMEPFMVHCRKKAKADVVFIDSSKGIQDTLNYPDRGGAHKKCKGHHHGHKHAKHDHHGHHHDADHHEHGHHHDADHHEHGHHHDADHHKHGHHAHCHHHSGVNPHLFVSPRMVAKIAMNVADGLAKVDPEGKDVYFKNAQAYATSMNSLADEMEDLGKRLKNRYIVQPHGVFDYLARDMGITIVGVLQPHGREPSAAARIKLVKTIKEKKVGGIFIEPQYSGKVGKSLAKETGVPLGVLDPVTTGPEAAPRSYYEKVMRQNMKTLRLTLGVK